MLISYSIRVVNGQIMIIASSHSDSPILTPGWATTSPMLALGVLQKSHKRFLHHWGPVHKNVPACPCTVGTGRWARWLELCPHFSLHILHHHRETEGYRSPSRNPRPSCVYTRVKVFTNFTLIIKQYSFSCGFLKWSQVSFHKDIFISDFPLCSPTGPTRFLPFPIIKFSY